MPGAQVEGPSVPMSFANNFWGKDDAGVQPLLLRMHSAKITSEELKSFYRARAEIEDDYARKLLSLCRKPLGKDEAGTLRSSLDCMRAEVESMARAHKSVAEQMKTELEEPIGAFAGMMKERRKIVQGGVEKLLKVKNQQTSVLNKSRDKYEQDCLRIKGYLAQGHMVMGQEERKNKAKLEKTQLQMSASENEYKYAVAALEETTGRWNRDWKAACDKFQDLEEERLDFTKSSLWTFANIASTVCVTDDASCEKIRMSLESCEVEKDIASFIHGQGTGQEIPEPPKFINFCRDDIDSASEISDDDYSVAQFPRTINPAYRTSSPQPSTLDHHQDEEPEPVQQPAFSAMEESRGSRENTPRASQQPSQQQPDFRRQAQVQSHMQMPIQQPPSEQQQPLPLYHSDRSTNVSPSVRPGSSDHSDYSAPTSISSAEPLPSPTKQPQQPQALPEQNDDVQKKRSGFFSNSPFRRRSKHEKSRPGSVAGIVANHTVSSSVSNTGSQVASISPTKPGIQAHDFAPPAPDLEAVDPRASFQLNVGNNVFDVASPDSRRKPTMNPGTTRFDRDDPVAAALEELRGLTGRGDKGAAVRTSADRYHGLATPSPGQQLANNEASSMQRSTPPPQYGDHSRNTPVKRLDAPAPAHTKASMTATTRKYTSQNANMYGNGPAAAASAPAAAPSATNNASSRPGSRMNNNNGNSMTGMQRSASPVPIRSASPRPGLVHAQAQQESSSPRHHQRQGSAMSTHGEPLRRSASPNPYGQSAWAAKGAQSAGSSPIKQQQQQQPAPQQYGRPQTSGGYGTSPNNYGSTNRQPSPNAPMNNRQPSPGASMMNGGNNNMHANHNMNRNMNNNMNNNNMHNMRRDPSPQPAFTNPVRPNSGMAMTLSNGPPQQQQARGPNGAPGRPVSYYGGGGSNGYAPQASPEERSRSKSLVQGQQWTRDGRQILHFARAMYSYTAAIPEELSFAKNDVLAVTRLQDDGWWEAEVTGRNGRVGLVPSNYLQRC